MAVAARTSPAAQLARAESEGWRYKGDMRTEGEVLDLLFSLVCVTKPTVAVETGTYQGHGAQAISEGLILNDKGHLWTVEVGDGYDYQEKERVTFVRADSLEWSAEDAPPAIDFAFVDCCEDSDDRIEVFSNLWERLTEGGLISVHDTHFYLPEFEEGLSEAAGKPPGLSFPALNGFSVWMK